MYFNFDFRPVIIFLLIVGSLGGIIVYKLMEFLLKHITWI